MSLDFNGQSGNHTSSSRPLKRMEFEFNGVSYKFALNPETYNQQENGILTATKTKGGAFLEAFGPDIPEIDIAGTTGFKNNTGDPESGYQKFKALRDMIKSVYDNVTDGSEITTFLNFYNYTDNEYYVTYPSKFELSRSKSQPLLYKYSIHLFCLRRIGEAAPDTTVTTIGNPIGIEKTTDLTLRDSSTVNTSNVEDTVSADEKYSEDPEIAERISKYGILANTTPEFKNNSLGNALKNTFGNK